MTTIRKTVLDVIQQEIQIETSMADFWTREAERSNTHENWVNCQNIRVAHMAVVDALLKRQEAGL
jgi:septum formation topological specificity factor MinE